MLLDAHQHFWRFSEAEYSWIKPEWPIRRDFLPPDLEPVIKRAGLSGSIAVQARQSLEETRWLLELADRHSVIKGVVGWVDLRSRDVGQQLSSFANHRSFVGVRHVVQDEPDDNFMLGEQFKRGIAALESFRLTYDLLVFSRQLPAAIELASLFPRQRFVLDHLAKPDIKTGMISPWRERIIELGRHPNVSCKISGMVTEADWKNWKKKDFQKYLETAVEAFGMDRLMFGSDWPVCLLAGTYERVFDLARGFVASLGKGAEEKIFDGNAERFYLQRGKVQAI